MILDLSSLEGVELPEVGATTTVESGAAPDLEGKLRDHTLLTHEEVGHEVSGGVEAFGFRHSERLSFISYLNLNIPWIDPIVNFKDRVGNSGTATRLGGGLDIAQGLLQRPLVEAYLGNPLRAAGGTGVAIGAGLAGSNLVGGQ